MINHLPKSKFEVCMSQSTRKTQKGLLYIEHLKLLKCYQSLIKCILMIRFPQHTLGFPCGSYDKQSTCSAGDPSLIPRSGRSPGERHGYPLQYSCLENPMDRGAWWALVHGVAKSQTQLSDSAQNTWLCTGVCSKHSTCSSRSLSLLVTLNSTCCYCSHSLDEETEAQRM